MRFCREEMRMGFWEKMRGCFIEFVDCDFVIGLFSTPVCTIRLLEMANQSADFQLCASGWVTWRVVMGLVGWTTWLENRGARYLWVRVSPGVSKVKGEGDT